MSWLQRIKIWPSANQDKIADIKKKVPEGLWTKCESCASVLFKAELERNLLVCPKCNHHMVLSARERLNIFLDPEHRQELGTEVKTVDILKFKDTKKYKDRLVAMQKNTGEKDALVVMHGSLNKINLVAAAFEFAFIGGSMGASVGERFVIGVEYAIQHGLPFVCFSSSGGARMQEGLISLMQMAKTSCALAKLARRGLPYISIMVNPTFGGVSASLAMLGDINIAEPHALIGFTGPRVIEQTVREILPEGFQQSEFLLEHGFVDKIVDRREMRLVVTRLLASLLGLPSVV